MGNGMSRKQGDEITTEVDDVLYGILMNIAYAQRASTNIRKIIGTNGEDSTATYQKVAREMRKAITNGYIKKSYACRMQFYRFTEDGLRYLEKACPRLFEYYMASSGGNRMGYSEKHISPQIRTSEALAMMQSIGVLCGTQKPSHEMTLKNPELRLELPTPSFYTRREFRIELQQKKTTMSLPRMVGCLFSSGFNGAVYNLQDDWQMEFNGASEMRGLNSACLLCSSQYKDKQAKLPRDAILFFSEGRYDVIEKIMYDVKPTKKSRYKIANQLTSMSNLNYHAVPLDAFGKETLKLLILYKENELLEKLFTHEEICAAKQIGYGDACCNGIVCFEMLTMNLNKLYFITQAARAKQEQVFGIISVAESNVVTFIKNYLSSIGQFKFRTYTREELHEIFKE